MRVIVGPIYFANVQRIRLHPLELVDVRRPAGARDRYVGGPSAIDVTALGILPALDRELR